MVKRLKQIKISPDLLVKMFEQGNKTQVKTIKGIPEGTEIFDCKYDMIERVFVIYLKHDSFKFIKSVIDIPVIDIECENIE